MMSVISLGSLEQTHLDGYLQKVCKKGRKEGSFRQREKLIHHVTATDISARPTGVLELGWPSKSPK